MINRLFFRYGILPYKVSVSREGGIFAAFQNPRNKNILRVEVDNDLDVVAVVSDGVSILESGLLQGDDVELAVIESFDSAMASKAGV